MPSPSRVTLGFSKGHGSGRAIRYYLFLPSLFPALQEKDNRYYRYCRDDSS